jgi:hydrogenase assembly chaperone HypC/HupF
MCLAIPSKIITIEGDNAVVELNGIKRRISLSMLPEAKEGDYVMVHAGFAIAVVDEDQAREEIELWEELRQMMPDTP